MKDLEELDPDFIMAKQVEQLEKEKKELQERLKNQEKKVEEDLGSLLPTWNFPSFLFCFRSTTLRGRSAWRRSL